MINRILEQQEIDYLEEFDGKVSAYEFKWNPKKSIRFPKTFINNYSISKTTVINKDNIESFLL